MQQTNFNKERSFTSWWSELSFAFNGLSAYNWKLEQAVQKRVLAFAMVAHLNLA
jgi:diacylglycerol kinase